MSFQSFYCPHSDSQHPIRIETLGGPRFFLNGKTIELGPKAASLLAVVASTGEKDLYIEQLYELLWSSGSDHVLQKRVGHFRRHISATFGDFDPLVWDAHKVRLNCAHACSDLASLAELLRSEKVTDAAKLVSSGFLSHLKVIANAQLTSWINLREVELKDDVRKVATRMRSSAIGRANWDLVVDTSSALLRLEPRDENLLVSFLQDLARVGKPEEAYLVYRTFLSRNEAIDPSWQPRDSTLEVVGRLRRLAQVAGHHRLAYRPLSEDRPSFVGRARELRELRLLLSERGLAGLRVICVSGQPGSGRTRLVDEALLAISPSPQPILRCSRKPAAKLTARESHRFWKLDLEWLPPNEPRSLDDPTHRLEVLVDRFSDMLAISEDIDLTQRAVYSELVAAIRTSPHLILVVDDFELAPAWIRHLPTLLQTHPIRGAVTLILITYDEFDPTEAHHSDISVPLLRVSLSVLEDEHLMEIVSHKNNSTDTRSLDTSDLTRLANGRPGIAMSLIEHGFPPMDEFDHRNLDQIPVSIRSSLLKRLETLPSHPLLVLQALCCSSGLVRPQVIREILDLSERELESSLEDLEEKSLIHIGPRGVRIPDPLLALVLRATLPSTRRIRMSREFIKRLTRDRNTQNPPNPGLHGPHFLKLAKHHLFLGDIERAKTEALAAARSDLEFVEYESCLRLLQVIADNNTELVPSVSYEIASLLERLGKPERAKFHFREAERRFRLRGEAKKSLHAGLLATRSSLRLPDTPSSEAQAFLENAFSVGVQRGWLDLAAQALQIELRLADSEFRFNAAGKTLDKADRLRRGISPVGPAGVKLDILRSLGIMFGRREESISIGWEAVSHAQILGNSELQAEATNSLMASLLYLGKLETKEGERLLVHLAGPASLQTTDQEFRRLSRMNRAVWSMDTWDYELALDLLKEEVEDTSIPQFDSMPLIRLNYAIALYQMRMIAEAERELDFASKRLGPRPSSAAQIAQVALSGLIALERGSLEEAGRRQTQLEKLDLQGPFDPTLALELHARWYWYHGQRSAATGLLDKAIDQMGSSTPLYRASAWELLARLYERDGSLDRAENARKKALTIAKESNVAHLTWRLLRKLRYPRSQEAR